MVACLCVCFVDTVLLLVLLCADVVLLVFRIIYSDTNHAKEVHVAVGCVQILLVTLGSLSFFQLFFCDPFDKCWNNHCSSPCCAKCCHGKFWKRHHVVPLVLLLMALCIGAGELIWEILVPHEHKSDDLILDIVFCVLLVVQLALQITVFCIRTTLHVAQDDAVPSNFLCSPERHGDQDDEADALLSEEITQT